MSRGVDPLDSVLTALAADPDTDFSARGASLSIVRRVDGPFSSVARVRIATPARTTHAYIKVLKPRRQSEEELARIDRLLKREFTATQALYDALKQDTDIAAVRPIAIVHEHRALATEEVPGRPLGELLAEATRLTDEMVAIVSRVGAWTRVYQRIGGTTGEIELSERRTYLDDRLKRLEGRVLTASDHQATLERFDGLAREIGAASVPAVPIHADLTPMNVIVDERGRVAVLDFTMAKTGTVHHDLSHMYFHLELMATRHRGQRALFRALQRAMLAGYDPTLSAGDPLFRLMLMQHSVCHIAMLAERRVPIVDAAYRWFLRRRWHVCEQIPPKHAELQVA
jgi:Ser/Thr protein kinase RdoA (MazF antagonist)